MTCTAGGKPYVAFPVGVRTSRGSDHARAFVQQSYLPCAPVGVAERDEETRDVERERHVRLAHDLASCAARVEWVMARNTRRPWAQPGAGR